MKNKMMEKFKSFKIGTKIILYYFIISAISISFSTFLYQNINKKIMTQKVSEMAVQTLQVIDSNLNLLIDTVNNESKILLSNLNFQNILMNSNKSFNYNSQTAINRYLTEFIQSNASISSVYVFDNYGNRYFVDKMAYKSFSLNNIKSTYWYDELQKAQGRYIIKLNGGGLFNQSDKNYVSFIRIINDLESQKPTGIMVINIPEDAISNSFRNITENNDVDIMLKDENDNDIIHSNEVEENNISEDILKNLKNKGKGDNYIITNLTTNLNWTITSKVPFSEISKQTNIYMFIMLGILLLSGVMSFLGLILVSSSITRPIDKLIKSMRAVENGEFKKVSVGTGNDEIAKLKTVYNSMIYKIEKLIEQIMVEQKIKRKAELNVLQAQIKPHFLYNSFDAISCLALEGKNDDVYKIIKSLGNFYRTSLSNGREVISVREELETVKSYLTILQIRYENLFEINMDIDERCDECKILKLVLQPIVENSIYHGIKPSRRKGNIFISTSLKNDYVELVVQDDGVGISEDKLNMIKGLNTEGIGLRSTIERLNIFYNGKGKLEVESKLLEGTKVTITIPIREDENNGL